MVGVQHFQESLEYDEAKGAGRLSAMKFELDENRARMSKARQASWVQQWLCIIRPSKQIWSVLKV